MSSPNHSTNVDLPASLRRRMPAAANWAYLDHAAVAPISLPAAEAVARWALQSSQQGATLWSQWNRGVGETRAAAARLIGALPEEIALVGNTTAGIGLIAEGLPWAEGDNVVTLADEFPSNLYPWLNLATRGVETRRLETDRGRLDLNRLEDACDERTRLVSVSWVGYSTGFRHDLAALADLVHRRGALLLVDAIQGLGAFPIDAAATPFDFLAADGHKWLLGPEGAGVLYIRREHLDRVRATGVGWHSVVHAHDFTAIDLDLKPSAERFEGGSQNMPGLLGLGASMQLLLELGMENVAGRILSITDLACDRLAAAGATIVSHRDGPHRSGIVSFEMPGRDPQAIRQTCLERGVVMSCRAGRLRISPHAYNDVEDVDRLIAAMADD
jgi:selenocysteine lyase/cysteine desulfurase